MCRGLFVYGSWCAESQAYWLDMPDKRAVSVWVAMDEATVHNGCMWFGACIAVLEKHNVN